MVATNALTPRVTQFLSHVLRTVNEPSGGWIAELTAAAEEFNLAPDVWLDVNRLPRTVVDLPTLVEYLRVIRAELNSPTDDTKTSGRLKLYKLFVCAIHAYSDYLEDAPDYSLSAQDHTDAVFARARANPPEDLSVKARTLWNATFEPTNSRARNCLAVLIFFGQQALTTGRRPPPGGPGGRPVGPTPPASDPRAAAVDANDGYPDSDDGDEEADDEDEEEFADSEGAGDNADAPDDSLMA